MIGFFVAAIMIIGRVIGLIFSLQKLMTSLNSIFDDMTEQAAKGYDNLDRLKELESELKKYFSTTGYGDIYADAWEDYNQSNNTDVALDNVIGNSEINTFWTYLKNKGKSDLLDATYASIGIGFIKRNKLNDVAPDVFDRYSKLSDEHYGIYIDLRDYVGGDYSPGSLPRNVLGSSISRIEKILDEVMDIIDEYVGYVEAAEGAVDQIDKLEKLKDDLEDERKDAEKKQKSFDFRTGSIRSANPYYLSMCI